MRLVWIALSVLVLDQVTKIVVRINMGTTGPRESIGVLGDWLKLTYTENPGMAFGIMPGSTSVVTACSVIATILIIVYLLRVRKGYAPYTMCLAAILGGAIGNIVDRLFYGLIFEYGPFFEGRVVDFIHFNIWSGLVPGDIPLIGGEYLALFPIFNVADIAICGGVAGVLIFQKQFHLRRLAEGEAAANAEVEAANAKSDRSAAGGPAFAAEEAPLPD